MGGDRTVWAVGAVLLIGIGLLIYGSTEYISESGVAVVVGKPTDRMTFGQSVVTVRWKGRDRLVRCSDYFWETTTVGRTIAVEQRRRRLWEIDTELRVKEY